MLGCLDRSGPDRTEICWDRDSATAWTCRNTSYEDSGRLVKCLTTGCLKQNKNSDWRICQFLRCKHSRHGWFQAIEGVSRNMELGIGNCQSSSSCIPPWLFFPPPKAFLSPVQNIQAAREGHTQPLLCLTQGLTLMTRVDKVIFTLSAFHTLTHLIRSCDFYLHFIGEEMESQRD